MTAYGLTQHQMYSESAVVLADVKAAYSEIFNIDIPVPFPVDAEAGIDMYELHGIH